jgi:hypothetical protein
MQTAKSLFKNYLMTTKLSSVSIKRLFFKLPDDVCLTCLYLSDDTQCMAIWSVDSHHYHGD